MGFATKEQAAGIWAAMKERDEDREARMPDHRAALHQAHVAQQRLKSLGWRAGIYCPKDGSEFALVEWGSTGVHLGHYMGEWPEGSIYSGDFLIPPHAVMFKPIDKLSSEEKADLERSRQSDEEFMGRQLSAHSSEAST